MQTATRELESLLSEDMACVLDRERNAFDRILAESGGRLVLFGSGSLGRSALQCLRRDGIRPLAFCDNNAALWGRAIDGVPVLSPHEASSRHGSTAAFFVTIWGLTHRYADTHDRLTAAGCRSVHPAAPIRWKYADELLPFFLQDLPHMVNEQAADVLAASRLWADARSRVEYAAQVRYRALGDFYCLPPPDAEVSYFLDSLYNLNPAEVFVDCGAFDGDTLREAIRRGGFTRYIALEPDPGSFHALGFRIASLPPEIAARVSIHPCAAASTRGHVRFTAAGELSSGISSAGDVLVETAPLDELASDAAPTFIKMDIEGAEMDALEGARKVISRHHPLLAICVYHRQSDLWRIPLLIRSMWPGYRFYLRTHEPDGWQTVCYAIPPERLKS